MSVVGVASSGAAGADIEVRVEIADATGNSSLSALAARLHDGISSGEIGTLLVAGGMSVQLSVVAGPDVFGDEEPLDQVTVTVGLSGESVESFYESSGAILMSAIAELVGVGEEDVSITEVSETATGALAVEVVVVASSGNVSATEVASTLTAAVAEGKLTSALREAGLAVSAGLLEAAEVSTGGLPYEAPVITGSVADRAVVAVIGMLGESVETLDATKQERLVAAVAAQVGVGVGDVSVCLLYTSPSPRD